MKGIAVVLVGLSGFASHARADAPPTDRITIDIVTLNGTGCPTGTAFVSMSPDNSAFHIGYSSYVAQIGVGARPTDFRKNCQVNLLVHAPPGFSYAIASVNYIGFASLAAGATALYQANYFFQGQPAPAFDEHSLSGPFNDDFAFSVARDEAALVFSPCNASRALSVTSVVRMSAGTSDPTTSSVVAIDNEGPPTSFHLVWRQCTDTAPGAAGSPPRS